jgi:maltoporin
MLTSLKKESFDMSMLHEAITKSSATLHNQHLFKVQDDRDSQFFQEEHTQQFHHSFPKFVLIQERVQRDIQEAVSFHSSRVKKLDEDDGNL